MHHSINYWPPDGNCQRCGAKRVDSLTMSIFNTQMICGKCDDAEIAHPKYNEAKIVELKETRAGNYNFNGIGLPPELEGGDNNG
jgi:ArsR family metal-binding transcriptional regulator